MTKDCFSEFNSNNVECHTCFNNVGCYVSKQVIEKMRKDKLFKNRYSENPVK